MPIFEVTDPKTGQTLEFEGAQPPDEGTIRQAFAQVSAPEMPQVQQVQQTPSRGQMLGQQAKELFAQGGIQTPSTMRPTGVMEKKILQSIGDLLGLTQAGETIGKTAAYYTRPSNVTPEMAKEAGLQPTTGEMIGTGLQLGSLALPFGAISKGVTAQASRILPSLLAKLSGPAIAGATGGYAYEAGEKIARGETPTPGTTTAISAIVPPAIEKVVGKFKGKPVDIALKETVKEGINKGIRPSVTEAGRTATQNKVYLNKAQTAVETIIGNKENLVFEVEGEKVAGRLPQSLNEFTQAIDQTKKQIFEQYDNLATQAGKTGAVVDLNPIAKELEVITNDKILKKFKPDIVRYAKKQMQELSEDTLTTTETQRAIKIFNNSLEAYYANPSYDMASKAYVDALIVNKMRSSLDDVIEKTTGAGYQELKNNYGALKTIEKDANRRTLVDARKNIKGLIDFSDIFSGSMALKGLTNLDPATIVSAATAKGISAWLKRKNDPNRIISKMFSAAEKLMGKAPSMAEKESPFNLSSLPTRLATYNLTTPERPEIQENLSPRLTNSLRSLGGVRP